MLQKLRIYGKTSVLLSDLKKSRNKKDFSSVFYHHIIYHLRFHCWRFAFVAIKEKVYEVIKIGNFFKTHLSNEIGSDPGVDCP